MRRALVAAAVLAATLGPGAAAAWATFPGRDGQLAVQPASGLGLELVDPRTGGERQLCPRGQGCGRVSQPSWSSDGRMLAFGTAGAGFSGLDAIYPDGTCFACVFPGSAGDAGSGAPLPTPAFGPQAASVTQAQDGTLRQAVPATGQTIAAGGVQAADWSSGGTLAISRRDRVWAGPPARLRDLGPGGRPSWSPDGTRLTFSRGGLVVTELPGEAPTRLARGQAPVWSPDGAAIAFFGAGHALELIPAAGGHARRVGRVTGLRAAWQPRPRAVSGCLTLPGETPVTSAPGVAVTRAVTRYKGGAADTYLGCLRTGGESRLLALGGPSSEGRQVVRDVTVAGDIVGFNTVTDGAGAEAETETTTIDLATGLPAPGIPALDTVGEPKALVVDPAGDYAVVIDTGPGPAGCRPRGLCDLDELMLGDAVGTTVVDSAAAPAGAPDPFTSLALGGGSLRWTRDGVAMTVPVP